MKNLVFAFLLTNFILHSQNQFSKWHFGTFAGLDFSTPVPVPLITTSLAAQEGCASIADANGNTLFYTNGVYIRDQTNAFMANGTGLIGNVSATQGVLIAKQPGQNLNYYVFTMAATAVSLTTVGLNYSIVDMSLAAGLGSVTTKNAPLLQNIASSECIAGARHCNGRDVWVVVRPFNSLNFYAYLLTSTGLNTIPIISTLGPDSIHTVSSMKISQSGKKIAFVGTQSKIVLADFDNATGTIGTNILVLSGLNAPYGIEFSPDGSKLYASTGFTGANIARKIYQWDLCSGNNQSILNSKFTVYSDSTAFIGGALQLSSNKKIYKARLGKDSIGVIHFPNALGAACGYSNTGQSLSGKTCGWGLPNFVSGYMKSLQPMFTFTGNCQNVSFVGYPGQATLQACSSVEYPILSSNWNFGDPASQQQNQSANLNTNHFYSAAGTYTVQLVINRQCSSDTLKQIVIVPDLSPSFSITGKTGICAGQSTTLQAFGNYSYTWSNSTSSNTVVLSPTVNTVYSVIATNTSNCTTTKTLTISVSKCLSIADVNGAEDQVVFQNPCSDNLNIRTSDVYVMSIFDLSGRCLLTTQLATGATQIDLSNYNKGIYFMKLTNENRTYYHKLIKE